MENRLYIIPHFKDDKVVKTHLAKGDSQWLETLCLPNIGIWLHNCECPTKCSDEDCGTEADIKWAEYWDGFFNEVTCQTCLRIARDGHQRKRQLIIRDYYYDRK